MKVKKRIKVRKIDYADIIERAVKTFIQAFISSLALLLPETDVTNKDMLKSLLVGALASAISAVMNYVAELLKGSE